MPSSTALISCSRETCFSALSWRRAPTKSRLTAPPRCCEIPGADKKKRGGHPRQRSGRSVPRKYTRPSVDRRSGVLGGRVPTPRLSRPVASAILAARAPGTLRGDGRPVGRIAPVDGGLEDVDELVDQP